MYKKKEIHIFNIDLYRRAFVHKSYVKRPQIENDSQNIFIVEKPPNCMTLKSKSNERLEFLGDGVLECITKYYLYKRFPKENEGFMTEKKIALVKNESIGRLAYEMGFPVYILIERCTLKQNQRLSQFTRDNVPFQKCIWKPLEKNLTILSNVVSYSRKR